MPRSAGITSTSHAGRCHSPFQDRGEGHPAGKGYHLGVPAIWRKLVRLAGLDGVRLRDLRHGFASFAIVDGDSLYLVGKVLGHTQASTTQ